MLSLTANWVRQFQYASSASLRVLVRLYTGASAYTSYLSGPCTLMTYPQSVIDVTSFDRELDPLTRETSMGQCDITLSLDDGVAYLLLSSPMYWTRVDVLLGEAGLGEADFAPYFSGILTDFLPNNTVVTLKLKSADILLVQKCPIDAFPGRHPVHVIKSILDSFALPTGTIDTASFDANTSLFIGVGHFIVARGTIDDWDMSKPIAFNVSAAQLVNELVQHMQGMLRIGEDGEISFVLGGGAYVRTWDDSELGAIKTETVCSNLITRVKVACFAPAGGSTNDHRVVYIQTDEAALAFGNSTYAPDTDYTIDNNWVAAHFEKPLYWTTESTRGPTTVPADTVLNGDPATGDGTFAFSGSSCGFCSGVSDAYTASPSFYQKISSLQPLYMLIDSEIISFETMYINPNQNITVFYHAPDAPESKRQSREVRASNIQCYGLTRGALGTTETDHERSTPMFDITLPVYTASKILERFAFGAPIITVEAPLSDYALQVGDMVRVQSSRVKWYNNAASTTNHIWEIIKKRTYLFDDSPRIEFTLCLYLDAGRAAAVNVRKIHGLPFTSVSDRFKTVRDDDGTLARYVQYGFDAILAGGMNIEITGGKVMSATGARTLVGDIPFTLTPQKSHLISMDPERGNMTIVTFGRAELTPDVDEGFIPLWRIDTDQTMVVNREDLRPKQPLDGVHVIDTSIGTMQFNSNSRLGSEVLPNPSFSVFSRDKTLYPPDSWDLARNAVATDWEYFKTPELIETVTATSNTGGSTTTVTLGSAPSDDDVLILAFASDSHTISSITQTNVTWTQRTSISVSGQKSTVWTGLAAASASASIAVALSSTGVGDPIIVQAWRNLASDVPVVDGVNFANGTGTVGASDVVDATSVGKSLLIGVAVRLNGSVSDPFVDYSDGFVEVEFKNGVSSPTSTAHAVSLFEQIAHAGSYEFNFEMSASDSWHAHCLAFEPVSWGILAVGVVVPDADSFWDAALPLNSAYWQYSSSGEASEYVVHFHVDGDTTLGLMSRFFSVAPNGIYRTYLRCYEYIDDGGPLSDLAPVVTIVNWFNSSRELIGTGVMADGTSDTVNVFGTDAYSEDWRWTVAPDTAAFAKVVLLVQGSIEASGATYHTLFDECRFERVGSYVDAVRASSQSVSSSTWTKVQFDTAEDPGGDFDTITNFSYSARTSGEFSVSAYISVDSLADTKSAYCAIYVNGASVILGQLYSNGTGGAQTAVISVHAVGLRLTAGDTLDIRVWHNHGSSQNVTGEMILKQTTY